MYRTLKNGGIVMTTFISTKSSEYGKGTEIEPNTVIPNSGPEAGVPHHFTDKEEVIRLMSAFKKIDLYHYKPKGILENQNIYKIICH